MAMTSEHQRRLQKAYSDLLKYIHQVDRITVGLYSAGVFTDIMKENVEEKIGRRKKIGEILNILPRRGDGAFDTFYNLLVEYEEYDAANLLYPERAKVRRQSKGSPVLVHDDDDDEIPERWPDNELHDPGKVVVVTTPQDPQDSPMKQLFYKAAEGKGRAYSMSKPCRGIFLLISNHDFKSARKSEIKLPDRHGTDFDRDALKSLFEQLGFHVIERPDRTGKEILKDVKEVSEIDHTYYDCFACSILTHGERDGVFGVDGESIHLDSLKDTVCASPSLVGKPKLFFIQACQGVNKDSGKKVEEEKKVSQFKELGIKDKQKEADKMAGSEKDDGTTTDAKSEGRVSSKADVFVAMATVPDFVSWRNTNWGTWFIQAVVFIFTKFAHKRHLADLMTDVNKLVSRAETKAGFKQVSVQGTSLTSNLYFFPGLKINCYQRPHVVESHSEVDICEKNKTKAPSENNKPSSTQDQATSQVTSMMQSTSLQPNSEPGAAISAEDKSP